MQPSLHVIRGIEDRHDSVVAALSEEHLVVADGTLLRSAELADAAASCVREIQLVCPATKVAISPSSEFVMALDANRARVWHQPGLESVFEIAVDAGRTSVGALFARLGGRVRGSAIAITETGAWRSPGSAMAIGAKRRWWVLLDRSLLLPAGGSR